jgi:hypothetical protein
MVPRNKIGESFMEGRKIRLLEKGMCVCGDGGGGVSPICLSRLAGQLSYNFAKQPWV